MPYMYSGIKLHASRANGFFPLIFITGQHISAWKWLMIL